MEKKCCLLLDPGQNFIAVKVGVLIINSCVCLSYVAVVSRPRTKVPCPLK